MGSQQECFEILVTGVVRIADTTELSAVLRPVLSGCPRSDDGDDEIAPDECTQGCPARALPVGQQEKRNEPQGRQLDGRSPSDEDAPGNAPGSDSQLAGQVHQNQENQDHIDLAKIEGQSHWLKPEGWSTADQ